MPQICDYASYGGLQNNQLTVNGTKYGLPTGDYDAATFAAALVATLNATSIGTFVATVDPSTLILTITCSAVFTIDFPADSPYVEMGVPLNYSSTGMTFTGVGPINLSGPRSIYLRIREFRSNHEVMYGGVGVHFCYPLTSSWASESQLNWLNAGKIDCPLQQGIITRMTLELYFTRAGYLWPYMANELTSYQLMLELW